MKLNAVTQAALAVDQAKNALATLERAESLAHADAEWVVFLFAFSRLFTKLEVGSRPHNQSKQWFSGIKKLRKEDQLLCYLHHARNSDHHRLEDVTQHEGAVMRIGSEGPIYMSEFIIVNGQIYADWSPAAPGAQLVVTLLSSRLVAIPVTDRGVTYAVPTSHLGQPLPDTNVLTLGKTAMIYAETLLQEARQRVI